MRIQRFALDDGCGLQLELMDWGASWLSARLHGRELLLGHADPAAYREQSAYMGAIVGRVANRIAGAAFSLQGRQHRLAANEGVNQLHGGPGGFHNRAWRGLRHSSTRVDFTLDSADGDQGFPSRLRATASYRITAAQQVEIHFEVENLGAIDTVAGLTSHAYFGLDGPEQGVLGQTLCLQADKVLPVCPDLLPTGEFMNVAGTPFDFRQPRSLGEGLAMQHEQLQRAGGYDHCWLLQPGLGPALQLVSADERRSLCLDTSYPALQIYGGQYLDRSRDRLGRPFAPRAGLAIEAQYPPDTVHHLGEPDWPQAGFVLRPGQTQRHWIRIRFEQR
ncbi:aldose epimerase family protein [Roseateles violae]|uniref:aldose epimerase family protein n=1 Tax=Roseateles violae TaxID=3058042 RepID=UPI0025B3ACE0|nr:aldose epimerase family protein [Pelomonas sp. PFR6]